MDCIIRELHTIKSSTNKTYCQYDFFVKVEVLFLYVAINFVAVMG